MWIGIWPMCINFVILYRSEDVVSSLVSRNLWKDCLFVLAFEIHNIVQKRLFIFVVYGSCISDVVYFNSF